MFASVLVPSRFSVLLRPWLLSLLALVVLLISVGMGHRALIRWEHAFDVLDDEGAYLSPAVSASRRSPALLPGTLPFTHRPPLTVAVYANVLKAFPVDQHPLATLRVFQIYLFLAVLGLLYLQGVLLRLGPALSLVPPLLLASFAWFGVYVHTAMSEVLHALLSSLGLTALLAFTRSWKSRFLLVAGVAFGLCLLTRGTLKPFLLVLVPWLFFETYAHHRKLSARTVVGFGRAGLALALLLVGVALSLGPQLFQNHQRGHGAHVSNNTWRNLEYGFRKGAPGDAAGLDTLNWRQARRLWLRSARSDVVREAAAKERTLKFLASISPWQHAVRQLRKASNVLFESSPLSDGALNASRWSEWGVKVLVVVQRPSRILWYFVLGAGLLGALLQLGRGAGFRLLALYIGCYLLGFALVPLNLRLFMPVVPALCLAAAGGMSALARLSRGGSGRWLRHLARASKRGPALVVAALSVSGRG